MELIDKEVRFDLWCNKCKWHHLPETEDPCDICLENPSNEWSHKPVYFEEKDPCDICLENPSKSFE